ncbi:MAG: putative sugar O-methyltransferase [Desulfatibacillum sp.]|nr:putative sugar O-methyltransferase [Desulfatibacillum sp.]
MIKDDSALLELFLTDGEIQDEKYQPTAYWREHAQRIVSAIRQTGLGNFRSDPRLGTGYTHVPLQDNTIWDDSFKHKIGSALMKLPGFMQADRLYRHKLTSSRKVGLGFFEKYLNALYFALSAGSISGPVMDALSENTIGNPYLIDIEDKQYTRKTFEQAVLLSLLRYHRDFESIKSVLEIGAGYGGLCESIHKCARKLEYYVIVDIVPIVYISTQYLKACFPGEVVDYRDIRDKNSISLSDVKGKILVIPPWKLPQLDLKFDLFWNTFSFQEMENNIVQGYISEVASRVQSIFVASLVDGHNKGKKGQIEPVSMAFIEKCIECGGFADKTNVDKKSLEYRVFKLMKHQHSFKYFEKLA